MGRRRKCAFGTGRVIGYTVMCTIRSKSPQPTNKEYMFVTDDSVSVLVSECSGRTSHYMAAKGKMNSERGIRDAIRSQTMIEIEEEDWRPVSIQKTIVSTPYDDSILD